ncbi:helix-turn-helix domain-containing protein [Actinopolyspora halophila]|uniref:helix-turn-helix domain-containing protein n=1 Tax=Actinopolyspora halophila TaxID=1850 RepID=UPI00037E7ACD|nr:helix-turn-helix transcriptional regulator [Actinopolyspora halophila]
MTETSSPTVWRRWLAFELVRLRRENGLEQKDVAKALRCTKAKVSYIETAERPVVIRDLEEVLLSLYGVPEERWSTYLEAARNSRRKGWWESYDSEALPDWFSPFVGLEQGASQIRTYEAQLIPGLLQTSDYANALLRRSTMERSEHEREASARFRMTRQSVFDRESPPRLWAVLDEAVLRRLVGSRETMRFQLERLASATHDPKITVQVLPFTTGAHPGMTGPFTMLGFPWEHDPGVVFLEYRSGALYLEEAHAIESHTVAFEHLCALALSPDESVDMIRTIAKEFSDDEH